MQTREYVTWAGVLTVVGLALWQRKAIVDVVTRGKRLTWSGVDETGIVPLTPSFLRDSAELELGRGVDQVVYDLARMIRSEGAAAGRVRAHVAINDARELGWDLHRLLTYSTNRDALGWYGEQFTPADRAPMGIKSVRRYSTARDPYEGDIDQAERVILERAQGIDPTDGGVKFVDKSSMGVQEGSASFPELVARWAKDGLVPASVPGYSADLVVFRRGGRVG